MKFQPGDLLICVSNEMNNPEWKGILPEVGRYYTWRGYFREYDHVGYVEEIVSPMEYGCEYAHAVQWYEKVDSDVDVNALLEECTFETSL